MRERKILTIKLTLYGLSIVSVLIGSYIKIDNLLLQVGLDVLFIGIMLYKYVIPTGRILSTTEIEIIFNGFDYKGAGIFLLAWSFLAYSAFKTSGDIGYSFYALAASLITATNFIKLITFDYSTGVITGLFDNKEHNMTSLTVEHSINEQSHKIKISDAAGFYVLDKKVYRENIWRQLLENLEKIKGWT
jgi:hypothetical protein